MVVRKHTQISMNLKFFFLAVRAAVKKLGNGNVCYVALQVPRCHSPWTSCPFVALLPGPPTIGRPVPWAVQSLLTGRCTHKSAMTLPCLHTQLLSRNTRDYLLPPIEFSVRFQPRCTRCMFYFCLTSHVRSEPWKRHK